MAKYCSNCGNKLDEKAYVCPKCGVIVNNDINNVNSNVDKGGIGWSFLGFFFPIVGLVLYLVWKNEKPKSAKASLKGFLISVIIGVIFYILVMLFLGIVFLIMAANM